MTKPQYTYIVQKGKPRLIQDAKDSRNELGQSRSEQKINIGIYLLKKAKLNKKLLAQIKFLQELKRSGLPVNESNKKLCDDLSDLLDETQDAGEEFLKLRKDVQASMGTEIKVATKNVLGLQKLREETSPDVIIHTIATIIAFLMVMKKIINSKD